ncbi:/ uvrC / Excinuclease ABC subunit C /:162897 Forward [Candidatus Hepatoplasma crinochetorum]|uniref:/ uvrC / Excinuclease ABC subunit C /:162897 Forward n=1 Tax=Candidatus Hepatoplasma crinochetorum TaxID=295596 RepID=A0A0G7ZNH6_9MOLU|nr:/ uvrC / Excinuclease ABC subunit C /:162897 Forward [Candidatus Hepatoplasma crinochetorum]
MIKKEQLKNIPNTPGCYLWKDSNGFVIYVGKAKKLRNRMLQYFDPKDTQLKTKLLVKQIADFDYMLVKNEIESLILELELIKKYNPKYNIRLKNQKSYPYILFSKEPMLRLELTNKFLKNKRDAKYFGPFPDGYSANKIKKIIESIYPVSKCLNPHSGKPCLNYQMGICAGYCFKNKEEIDTNKIVKEVENFFKGTGNQLKKIIIDKIRIYTEKEMYEQAQSLYNLLPILEKYHEKQQILFNDNIARDVLNFFFANDILVIVILHIRYGKLINKTTEVISIKKINYQNIESLIEHFLYHYYQKNLIPNTLIIPFKTGLTKLIDFQKVIIPKQGRLKDILALAKNEAKQLYNQSEVKVKQNEDQFIKAEKELEKILKTNNLNIIEGCDISNLAGQNQVGVVISFLNYQKNPSMYRKYHLEEFQNDYQAIYEVTYRHFRQKLIKKEQLANLFIVDGKHQLDNAKKALIELNLYPKIKIIGLVKDKKHNTAKIITEDKKEFIIENKSPLYFLLGGFQDEVHRFAITFYRNKQQKSLFNKKKS